MTSERTANSRSLNYMFTLQELFHSRSLSTYCNSGVPSFALPKDFKLVNLQEIGFEDPIEDLRVCSPQTWEWIVQILALASNLRSIYIVSAFEGIKLIIQRLHEIISPAQQNQMKHFDIILGGGRSDEDIHYPYSTFFDKLSTLFPNLETITLFMDQEELDESYDSFTSPNTTTTIACWKFETLKYDVVLIDMPGYRHFIKNMITSASQADCTILNITVTDDFEASICRAGQTREHVLFAFTLGIRHLIFIAINKMDTTDSPYSESRFEEIKAGVSRYIKGSIIIGWSTERIEDNASGKTLLEVIHAVPLPSRLVDKPHRLAIENVYNIAGTGTN
ncbi:unnamed protein product [Didymodactylos carnosus]|uniref:Tr-type G domain-containing protein n=1 Tax=Didymodactylos carnosus TaxID=1234261 RepID=A0A815IHT6_9BILA|nr:unnamed protein product [Didymodactylos carnosus]CAF4248715.1 unnamed protein product [Didymodactylos carnosus]